MPFPSASNLGAHRANPLHACSGAPTKRSNLPFVSYLLLLVFACVLFLPLYRGRSLYWGDILLYFAPMLRWEQTALPAGTHPIVESSCLVRPAVCGQPTGRRFLSPHAAPALCSRVALPQPDDRRPYLAVRRIYDGAIYTVGRRAGQAAFAGAVVYMGGACLIGRAQFPPMIFTAAYFPLLLCSLDQCLDAAENGEKKRRRLVKTLSNSRSRAWTTGGCLSLARLAPAACACGRAAAAGRTFLNLRT